MDVTVKNTPLRGRIPAPPSKSDAHRALICAALADGPTTLELWDTNADIEATLRCLEALGASVTRSEQGLLIEPIRRQAEKPLLDCGESGSTLRFLLPVAAVTAKGPAFTGSGRLPQRPIGALLEALSEKGCAPSAAGLPLSLTGKPRPGEYRLPGNISSQYITGLLLALPLLEGDSSIRLTTPLESAAYVEMTSNTLHRFGVRIETLPDGWLVPGGQIFRSPGLYPVEGDWSGAAFLLAADALGGQVEVTGLASDSAQPDRAIARLVRGLPDTVDVSAFPDLFPVLAVLACGKRGDTLLCGAARLRIKESDRIAQTARMLRDLGGNAEELPDALRIRGTGRLRGGHTHSAGDHRIAMAAAVAAVICETAVTISGAEAADKSFPAFWDVLQALQA